jgi:hypothetical protein
MTRCCTSVLYGSNGAVAFVDHVIKAGLIDEVCQPLRWGAAGVDVYRVPVPA